MLKRHGPSPSWSALLNFMSTDSTFALFVVNPPRLSGDELLPAVDVVGRAREGRVGHDVYGERGDVGRSDDAPDGKRGAKLIAAVFEFIAEERCRQRCVDEAGGDKVDSDGRELERQVGCEGGECSGDCRRDPEADAWAAWRATWRTSKRCSSSARRACAKSMSTRRP